ncbi:unnamed protein product [Effrenium voratum]|nr:unnamed protein product [Effrenium voratum]
MAIWSCLLGLFLASRGDEQDQLQCISLDQYPGNCPPNLMTGACYSSREGVTWACLPDGLSGAPNCGGMALPADEEGFYNGYCSFYEKPTTTSTTTTTTPCPARRLRIINRCMEEPIWIAHEAARGLIGPSPQNQLILPDSYFDYCTPDKLTGTRYWPKMLCNDQGVNCLLGSSGGPGEGCSSGGQYDRCAPPLDTKFEATFGRRGAPCSGLSSVDCDFIDVSLVDGWTLPFRLTIHGKCSGPNDLHPTEIDCSGLTLDECPTREFMGKTFYDLQAHYGGYGSVAGCYSPCLKLTDPKWNNSATGDVWLVVAWLLPGCCLPGEMAGQLSRGKAGQQAGYSVCQSKVMTELSTQQLVSCVENPRACGGTGGCDGATAELAFEYLVDHPQTFEDVVSYQNFFGGKVACSDTIESHASRYPVVSITGFVKLPVNEYEALMEALVTKGPISVSVDASGWSPYSSGVADFCPTDENVDIDHAVVLVAYGGDGDNKYWTIKNSWGPTWGEKGYIRLKRHDDEGKHCGWDKTPSHGSLCADEEDKPEWVCGTCGVLFDTSHPVGSKVIGASEGDVGELDAELRWLEIEALRLLSGSSLTCFLQDPSFTDIAPLSISGIWRSVAVQLEAGTPGPDWLRLVKLERNAAPHSLAERGFCLDSRALYFTQDAQRWLLHLFWPLEPGLARGFVSSALLLVLGYALEYELGAGRFLGYLLGIQMGAAFLLLHFGFSSCLTSLEPAFAGLAVVMHRVNPKVHSDGMGKALKLPWEVEPRWHVWVLIGLLLLQAYDFPRAFVAVSAGLLLGSFCVLREPEAWSDSFGAVRRRSFSAGAAAHVALFVFTILFMPLTVTDSRPELWSDIQAALADGRALRPGWWLEGLPSSPPLIHMAMVKQLPGEALYISKVLLSFALPLLLSPLRIWVRAYSIFIVILLMYTMNCPMWRYPHWGFVSLAYLAVAFWKLPSAAEDKGKQA